MRIRKCDRCGDTYKPYENSFNTVCASTFNMNEEEIATTVCYDLCPKCKDEFTAWLDAHKTKLTSIKPTPPVHYYIADDCK